MLQSHSTSFNRCGKPVEGPPLCTFTITIGNSNIKPKPIASPFNATPGPEVPVIAKLPP